MSEFRNHKLGEAENALIEKFQASLPNQPVDVIALAKAFGCEVRDIPMKFGMSGAITKMNGVYRLYANGNEPETRRRFTYAHELAHFLLHKEDIGEGIDENIMFRSQLHNHKEVEANKLAAEILMPQEMVDELAETRQYGINKLASKFGVSRQALLVRLGIPEYFGMLK